MTDELQHLLRRADTSAPPPAFETASPAGLAAKVHKRFVRRRAVRTTALALATIALVAAAMIPSVRKPHSPIVAGPTAPTLSPAELNQRTASLSLEADLHTLTAAKLAAPKPSARKATLLTLHDPSSDMQLQRDRAALILVYEANQHVREKRPADAIATYRRTVELFPQSRWADVARQKLKEIES
jgi:hypothetical protein